MDELIKKILIELNVDECFIQNVRSYKVLKFYLRTRLTDLYKYHVYVNKSEKVQCSKEEIKTQMMKENLGWETTRDLISIDDVKMLYLLNSIKNDKEKWNKIIEQLRTDNPILSVDLELSVKPKQVIAGYARGNKREKTYMYYDIMNDCVDLLYVREDIKEDKEEKNKKIPQKLDPELEFIEYEKIRLNIQEIEEMQAMESGKNIKKQKQDKTLKDEIETNPPIIKPSTQKTSSENEQSNTIYYIMYEKVKRDGSIEIINVRDFNKYLDINEINKIVNKLENKYNRRFPDHIANVSVKGEQLIKKLFSKENDFNDDQR